MKKFYWLLVVFGVVFTSTASASLWNYYQDRDLSLPSIQERTTVYDDIAIGPKNLRLKKDEIISITENVLEWSCLTDKKDNHPYSLSGGEKRRLPQGTVRPGAGAVHGLLRHAAHLVAPLPARRAGRFLFKRGAGGAY